MAEVPWDMAKLSKPPKTYPAEGFTSKGVRAVFFEGLPLKGRPTRVFAWVGAAKRKTAEKVPGIVLVHGGAGTAFAQWVRQWNARGYAAIAMDTCGRVPKPGKVEPGVRHRTAGPDGWGGFDQLDRPIGDQWTYHAVADVILAHSLLRSLPEVDKRRIGVMGISWGGYLTSIVSGVDHRFRFVVTVYGCGYLKDGSPIHTARSRAMGKAKYDRWHALWDPSRFLPRCRTPTLWISGTNDLGFSMASRQRSYRAVPAASTLSIRVRWKHNYQTPWASKEIAAYADSMVGRGVPLAKITCQGRTGPDVWVSFASQRKIAKAQLCYTRDGGAWNQRRWLVKAAELDPAGGKATAKLAAGAKLYYVNLIDDRGLVVSSEHVELPG